MNYNIQFNIEVFNEKNICKSFNNCYKFMYFLIRINKKIKFINKI